MSAVLSALVPSNRCDGRTQSELSHVCRIKRDGQIPVFKNQETWLARRVFPPTRICPYLLPGFPADRTNAPIHNQHRGVFSTFIQNRRTSVFMNALVRR